MTKTQTQILDLFRKLPISERRALVEELYDTNLLGDSVYDKLSAGQKKHLEESLAQAERGEVEPSEEVFAGIARKYGLERE